MIQRRGEDMKKSLKYFIITIIAISVVIVAYTISQIKAEKTFPKIITEGEQEKLMLPKIITREIKKNYPDFVVPTMSDKEDDWLESVKKDVLPPFYCQGDFNGDGLRDIALILLNKKDKSVGKLIVFHRKGKKDYESFVLIEDFKYPTVHAVVTQKPGEIITAAGKGYRSATGPKKIILRNDSINFWRYESGGCVFHWENGEYTETWTHG